MEEKDTKYNDGGSFETTIGNTNYEVVMNFRDEGMSMLVFLQTVKNRLRVMRHRLITTPLT